MPITAGGESHPAPKQTLYFVGIIHGISAFVNPFTKKMGRWQAKSPPNRFFSPRSVRSSLYRACIQKKTIRWAKDLFENSPSCPGDLAFPRKSRKNPPLLRRITSRGSKPPAPARPAKVDHRSGPPASAWTVPCKTGNSLPGFPFRLCQTPRHPSRKGMPSFWNSSKTKSGSCTGFISSISIPVLSYPCPGRCVSQTAALTVPAGSASAIFPAAACQAEPAR